jgi:hypothetical protein
LLSGDCFDRRPTVLPAANRFDRKTVHGAQNVGMSRAIPTFFAP